MESVFFILIIVGIGIFSTRSRPRRRLPPVIRPANNARLRNTQRGVFDAESKQPLAQPRILLGPARIIDGDSLVIQKTQVRLFGVDAPELNHPYGVKAKWALVNLTRGQKVQAKILEQDTYGRTVARSHYVHWKTVGMFLQKWSSLGWRLTGQSSQAESIALLKFPTPVKRCGLLTRGRKGACMCGNSSKPNKKREVRTAKVETCRQ